MQYARTSRLAPRAHLASLRLTLCRCAQANQTDWIPAGDCPMRTRARASSAPRAASDSEGAWSERACVATSRTRGSQCPYRALVHVCLSACLPVARARSLGAALHPVSQRGRSALLRPVLVGRERCRGRRGARARALRRHARRPGSGRMRSGEIRACLLPFARARAMQLATARSPPPLHAPLLSGPPPPPSSDWQWLENGARVRINLENGPTYSWSMVDQAFGHPSRVCLAANLTNFLSTYWPTAAGCKSAARPSSMARGHLGIRH